MADSVHAISEARGANELVPVINPGHSFATVTKKITSVILTKDTPLGWFLMLAPSLAIGCSGAVLAFANAAPYATISIWEAHRSREFPAAMDWQKRILRAAQLVTVKYGIPGLKYAMDLNGYYGGPPRLPLCPPSEAAKREIEEAFRDLKG